MTDLQVVFTKDSQHSEYGYYGYGVLGTVVGFTQGCAVALMNNGSFVKAHANRIQAVSDKDTL